MTETRNCNDSARAAPVREVWVRRRAEIESAFRCVPGGSDPWTAERQRAAVLDPGTNRLLGDAWRIGVLPAWSMNGWDLRGADLRGADLRRASLEGADLERAVLRGTRMDDAILDAANMRGASLVETSLRGTRMRGAVLDDAVVIRARVQGASLSRATTHGSTWSGIHVNGVDLRQSVWGSSGISACLFDGSDLRGADLSGVRADFIRLRGCRLDGFTRWPDGFDPAAAEDDRVALEIIKVADGFALDPSLKKGLAGIPMTRRSDLLVVLEQDVEKRTARVVHASDMHPVPWIPREDRPPIRTLQENGWTIREAQVHPAILFPDRWPGVLPPASGVAPVLERAPLLDGDWPDFDEWLQNPDRIVRYKDLHGGPSPE